MRNIVSMPTELAEELMPYEHICRTKSYARRRGAQRNAGADECFVTEVCGARARLVLGRSGLTTEMDTLQAGGCSPLSLLTFFAAAKKVSAAPHRGEANRPKAKQGKANALRTTKPQGAAGKTPPACAATRAGTTPPGGSKKTNPTITLRREKPW